MWSIFINFSLRATAFQCIVHSEVCAVVVLTSEEMHTYMLIWKSLIHIHEKLHIQYWMYPSQRHLSSEYALLTFRGNGSWRYYQRWSVWWRSHFSKCLWLNCIAPAGMQESTWMHSQSDPVKLRVTASSPPELLIKCSWLHADFVRNSIQAWTVYPLQQGRGITSFHPTK